jgi:Zn-dependent alcohol dehydrogenase
MKVLESWRAWAPGERVPDIFIPQVVELHVQERLPFDKRVKFDSLDQIDKAAEDTENGGAIKPVVRIIERGTAAIYIYEKVLP